VGYSNFLPNLTVGHGPLGPTYSSTPGSEELEWCITT
jgi:hypothetical protein